MTKETLFEVMEKTPAACTRAVSLGTRVPLLGPALSWSPTGRCLAACLALTPPGGILSSSLGSMFCDLPIGT